MNKTPQFPDLGETAAQLPAVCPAALKRTLAVLAGDAASRRCVSTTLRLLADYLGFKNEAARLKLYGSAQLLALAKVLAAGHLRLVPVGTPAIMNAVTPVFVVPAPNLQNDPDITKLSALTHAKTLSGNDQLVLSNIRVKLSCYNILIRLFEALAMVTCGPLDVHQRSYLAELLQSQPLPREGLLFLQQCFTYAVSYQTPPVNFAESACHLPALPEEQQRVLCEHLAQLAARCPGRVSLDPAFSGISEIRRRLLVLNPRLNLTQTQVMRSDDLMPVSPPVPLSPAKQTKARKALTPAQKRLVAAYRDMLEPVLGQYYLNATVTSSINRDLAAIPISPEQLRQIIIEFSTFAGDIPDTFRLVSASPEVRACLPYIENPHAPPYVLAAGTTQTRLMTLGRFAFALLVMPLFKLTDHTAAERLLRICDVWCDRSHDRDVMLIKALHLNCFKTRQTADDQLQEIFLSYPELTFAYLRLTGSILSRPAARCLQQVWLASALKICPPDKELLYLSPPEEIKARLQARADWDRDFLNHVMNELILPKLARDDLHLSEVPAGEGLQRLLSQDASGYIEGLLSSLRSVPLVGPIMRTMLFNPRNPYGIIFDYSVSPHFKQVVKNHLPMLRPLAAFIQKNTAKPANFGYCVPELLTAGFDSLRRRVLAMEKEDCSEWIDLSLGIFGTCKNGYHLVTSVIRLFGMCEVPLKRTAWSPPAHVSIRWSVIRAGQAVLHDIDALRAADLAGVCAGVFAPFMRERRHLPPIILDALKESLPKLSSEGADFLKRYLERMLSLIPNSADQSSNDLIMLLSRPLDELRGEHRYDKILLHQLVLDTADKLAAMQPDPSMACRLACVYFFLEKQRDFMRTDASSLTGQLIPQMLMSRQQYISADTVRSYIPKPYCSTRTIIMSEDTRRQIWRYAASLPVRRQYCPACDFWYAGSPRSSADAVPQPPKDLVFDEALIKSRGSESREIEDYISTLRDAEASEYADEALPAQALGKDAPPLDTNEPAAADLSSEPDAVPPELAALCARLAERSEEGISMHDFAAACDGLGFMSAELALEELNDLSYELFDAAAAEFDPEDAKVYLTPELIGKLGKAQTG